jgi:hypothetical protein
MKTMKVELAKVFPGKDANDPFVALWAVLYAQKEYYRALEIALTNVARSLEAEGKKAAKALTALNAAMQEAMERMNSRKGGAA